jgi:DNA-binding NtrC family response regulator
MARARKPASRAPATAGARSHRDNRAARAARASREEARREPRSESARSGDRGDANFRTTVEDLVSEILASRRPWPLKKARRVFERAYVQFAIKRAGADRHSAATQLDIGFSTLKEKIRPR